MLDAWRSGRFTIYPDLPGWTGRRGRCSSFPAGASSSAGRSARSWPAQWATATAILLDDLEALDPDRWCVASATTSSRRPAGRDGTTRRVLRGGLGRRARRASPLSRHTLDSPHPDKWMRNAEELEPYWDEVAEVALRAHGVFAAPPRTEPVGRQRPVDIATAPPPPSPPTARALRGGRRSAGLVRERVHGQAFPQVLDGAWFVVDGHDLPERSAHRRARPRRPLNTHFRAFRASDGHDVGTRSSRSARRRNVLRCSRTSPP